MFNVPATSIPCTFETIDGDEIHMSDLPNAVIVTALGVACDIAESESTTEIEVFVDRNPKKGTETIFDLSVTYDELVNGAFDHGEYEWFKRSSTYRITVDDDGTATIKEL